MSDKSQKSVAHSLEIKEHLLPHIPYLLQDLWVLGSDCEAIINLIGSLNLPKKTRIIDLGCGKGAVIIRLAAEHGFHVTGIDAMIPFLEVARTKAYEYGVSHLCEFSNLDILKFTEDEHDFDIVVLASLGGIFGTLTDTVARLRKQVKSSGYMIIDDGYLKRNVFLDRNGYDHYRNHSESIVDLKKIGDSLLADVSTTEAGKQINAEYLQVIIKRGMELIVHQPEIESDIRDYLELQKEECDVIDNQIEGALWLLQKKDGRKPSP